VKELRYLVSLIGNKGRSMNIGLPSYYVSVSLIR